MLITTWTTQWTRSTGPSIDGTPTFVPPMLTPQARAALTRLTSHIRAGQGFLYAQLAVSRCGRLLVDHESNTIIAVIVTSTAIAIGAPRRR